MPEPDIFDAIGNPIRRAMLDALRERPRAVHEIAMAFPISRPAVSQHLKVLKDAGLVIEVRVGRERLYELDAEPLVQASVWLATYEQFWKTRIRALRALLDEEN